MNKCILLGLTMLLGIACKQSTATSTPVTRENLDGFWEQQGEGELVAFEDSVVTFYDRNRFACFPSWNMTRADFNSKITAIKVINDTTFTNQEGYTIFTYHKLATPPNVCKELTSKQINSHTYNFETLWHTFNEQYAFFKERNVDWAALKTKYQQRFTDTTPAFEFYTVLAEMVGELQDDHSTVEVPDAFEAQWETLHPETDSIAYKPMIKEKIQTTYLDAVRRYNGGQITWGRIDTDIAYIQFNGMDGLADYQTTNGDVYWTKAAESDDYQKDLIDGTHKITHRILTALKDTKACIIDLRFNSGGYDQVGLAFMSHFIDQSYEVFTKKRTFNGSFAGQQTINITPAEDPYLKPVFILTSPYTVSAAETTLLATMNFPNFSRVGSATNGAMSDMLFKELPNGWMYSLSNEVYESMTQQSYEVTGIPPTYEIPYPRDTATLFRNIYNEFTTTDSAIEKVKELMQ